MYFVKLTTLNGEPCYVNLSRVSDIIENVKGTHLFYGGEGHTIVKETFDDIRGKYPLIESR